MKNKLENQAFGQSKNEIVYFCDDYFFHSAVLRSLGVCTLAELRRYSFYFPLSSNEGLYLLILGRYKKLRSVFLVLEGDKVSFVPCFQTSSRLANINTFRVFTT